jgi:vacuolar-type H+-ATPase subunit H
MPQLDAHDELEVLAGLRERELELDQQLEDTRREARRVEADARQSAERLKRQAEAELLVEVQRLRSESAGELERTLAAVRDETRRRCEAQWRTAERNRGRALAWLLDRVAGRAES